MNSAMVGYLESKDNSFEDWATGTHTWNKRFSLFYFKYKKNIMKEYNKYMSTNSKWSEKNGSWIFYNNYRNRTLIELIFFVFCLLIERTYSPPILKFFECCHIMKIWYFFFLFKLTLKLTLRSHIMNITNS